MQAPDPIAVIGLGCRVPGARTPQAFWSLLAQQRSAIGPVPASRWRWSDEQASFPTQDTAQWFRRGGFIDGLEQFDADFFHLPEHEAARIDPQQRLALEVTWEALESACIRPRDLAGSYTGVVMGVGHSDHVVKILNDHPSYDGKLGAAGYECFVANRVSYALNLKGPSCSVNAACASSLHAVHQACQSLQLGECDLVIAGGVNVNLAVDESVSCAIAGWLSRDNECKSFREGGDGYVRGEGCGVLVLKRLADAQRDGDPVWGVLRGSVLGHNGLTNGISWPSGNAQRDLMRRALQRTGLAPGDVDYLEAHGTGAASGDRMEASAFADVLGAGREADRPLKVGCCKPNVGHLEAASGVIGLIKVLLSLQHESLPAIRGLHAVDPAIRPHPGIRFLTEDDAWPRQAGRPRVAAVSNFSFGGANALVLVEEAPARPAAMGPQPVIDDVRLLGLRARTDTGVALLAGRLREELMVRGQPLDDDDLHALNVHRTEFKRRVAYLGRGLAALNANLRCDAAAARISTADFPAALHGAPPVLVLGADLLGHGWADPRAELQRASMTARWLDEWRAGTTGAEAALQAAATCPAARRRFMAVFWVRAFHRLGVPFGAVVVEPGFGPAVCGLQVAGPVQEAVAAWIVDGQLPVDRPVPSVAVHVAGAGENPSDALPLSPKPRLFFGPNLPSTADAGTTFALGLDRDTDWPESLGRLLLGLFCLGVDLRWAQLSPGVKRPVSAAPFEPRHCWFVAQADAAAHASQPARDEAPEPVAVDA